MEEREGEQWFRAQGALLALPCITVSRGWGWARDPGLRKPSQPSLGSQAGVLFQLSSEALKSPTSYLYLSLACHLFLNLQLCVRKGLVLPPAAVPSAGGRGSD